MQTRPDQLDVETAFRALTKYFSELGIEPERLVCVDGDDIVYFAVEHVGVLQYSQNSLRRLMPDGVVLRFDYRVTDEIRVHIYCE